MPSGHSGLFSLVPVRHKVVIRDGGDQAEEIFPQVLPPVIRAAGGAEGRNRSLFLVVKDLDQDLSLPVPVEDHLDVRGHAHELETVPVLMDGPGFIALVHSLDSQGAYEGKETDVMAETEVRRPVAPLLKGRISLGDDVLDQRLGYRRGVVARLPGYSETVVELLVAGDPERLQLLDREMLEYVRPGRPCWEKWRRRRRLRR